MFLRIFHLYVLHFGAEEMKWGIGWIKRFFPNRVCVCMHARAHGPACTHTLRAGGFDRGAALFREFLHCKQIQEKLNGASGDVQVAGSCRHRSLCFVNMFFTNARCSV